MEQDTLLEEEIDFDQQQEEQQHYHGEDIHSDENILNESTSNDNQEEIVNSDEQGQDEALCRICKQPAADDDPLFHPCKCSGSIKYIHESCLNEWMKHSNKGKYCEICKHQFKFEKVYTTDAPIKLSPLQFILGLLSVVFSYLKSISRILLVVFIWIVLVPFITYQFYRIVNITSWRQILSIVEFETLFEDFSLLLFIRDCMLGGTICLFVLLLDLITAGVLEFIKSNLELLENYVNPQQQNQVANNQPQPVNAQVANNANNNNNEVLTLRDLLNQEQEMQEEDENNGNENNEDQEEEEEEEEEENIENENNDNQPNIIQPPQPIVNNQPPNNPPQQQQQPREELDLEEMIGIKGKISHLIETVALVLFVNSQHILLLLFLPLQIGRFLCTTIVQELDISSVIYQVLAEHNLLKNTTQIISNVTQTMNEVFNQTITTNGTMANEPKESVELTSIMVFAEKIAHILTGYAFLIGMIYTYVVINYLLHYGISKKYFPISGLAKKLVYYTKYVLLLVKIAAILATNFILVPFLVGMLLVFSTIEFFKRNEKSVLPQDFTTTSNSTSFSIADQASMIYNSTAPIVQEFTEKNATELVRGLIIGTHAYFQSVSVEWVLSRMVYIMSVSFIYFVFGIVVVVIASSFIQMLRSFLSKRVLWFLRDPDDQNFHYLKELVTLGVFTHMRRIFFSFVFLSILVLALVRTPLKLARFILQDYDIFPLRLSSNLSDGAIYLVNYVYTHRSLTEAIKWTLVVLKSFIMGVFSIVLIPLLIGGAVHMSVVVPTTLFISKLESEDLDDSLSGSQPVLMLAEVWSTGLLFTIVAYKVVKFLPGTEEIYTEISRIKTNGFRNVEFIRPLNRVLLPFVYNLVLFLTLPFIVSKLVVPFFVTPYVQYQLFVLSYPALVFWIVSKHIYFVLAKLYHKLHDLVMDQLFLSQERLINHRDQQQ
ncbi:predicted protein [Naegleria gruberi]|uniref:RING-type E3 ubiquitin transferase n=1 Tax=Naegleria gruberi TaxID=5762 RepID=D2W0A3_NAEGR|nr:uncharacterized protein NAEGRDRAFT_74786 [Naegleria gruberi]EFC37539.1 predicted protein [Naegleria gruberi]|eukprot:XP_002670283.1 predicted protein [Naegleria gruberi strain NEG-M]